MKGQEEANMRHMEKTSRSGTQAVHPAKVTGADGKHEKKINRKTGSASKECC